MTYFVTNTYIIASALHVIDRLIYYVLDELFKIEVKLISLNYNYRMDSNSLEIEEIIQE